MGGKKKPQHDKRERHSDDEEGTIEQPPAKEEHPAETNEEKFEPVPPKKVSYCPSTSQIIQFAPSPSSSASTARRRLNAQLFSINLHPPKSTSTILTSSPNNWKQPRTRRNSPKAKKSSRLARGVRMGSRRRALREKNL